MRALARLEHPSVTRRVLLAGACLICYRAPGEGGVWDIDTSLEVEQRRALLTAEGLELSPEFRVQGAGQELFRKGSDAEFFLLGSRFLQFTPKILGEVCLFRPAPRGTKQILPTPQRAPARPIQTRELEGEGLAFGQRRYPRDHD